MSARAPLLIVAAIAAAIGAPSPASAQRLRMPIIVSEGEVGCYPGHIYNLQTADGFLAVRAGPSTRDRQLDRLRDDDRIYTCLRSGRWIGIVYAPRGSRIDCDVHRAWPVTRRYAGPCRMGWVHRNFVGVADLFDDELGGD